MGDDQDDGTETKIEVGTKNTNERMEQMIVGEQVETKDRDPQQNEQEMIQKGIAFWNHPALRDIPSSEKRSYLREQQGLTNSQIHKVWQEIAGSSSVGMENDNVQNRPAIAPQQYTGPPPPPHNRHHMYNNQPSSLYPLSNNSYGQYFNSNPGLDSYSQAQPNNAYGSPNNPNGGRQQPLPSMTNAAMEDGSISVARGLSLLGVGGALGVTGAAAVRWLNGGPFELFPTPATALTSISAKTDLETDIVSNEQTSKAQQAMDDQGHTKEADSADESPAFNDAQIEDEYDDHLDYEDAEYSDNNEEEYGIEEYLLERMDALLSSIDSNSVLQEKLILKLANTSTITDDSMNLLKQNSKSANKSANPKDIPANNRETIAQLKEVKEDMSALFRSMNKALSSNIDDPANETKEDWEKDCSKLFARFDSCIQTLEKPIDSIVVDSDAADSKSTSTAETTQTENQGRQDIPLLPPAPSTPAAGVSNETRISSSDMMETLMPLSLCDCIRKLVEKNNSLNLRSGSQLLYLYLANLSGKPDNRRYRKIFTSNESFQKVENLIGGKDLLSAVGFVEESGKGVLEWVPSGSTEEEISALIQVKEAAAALGVLKKPSNIPSSDLLQSALSKLSPSSPTCSAPSPPPPSPPPSHQLLGAENTNHEENVPQTPIGSSLLSPPMPKKMPFIPTPSDNLK